MNVAITGGARGIGRATAEAAVRAGHRVAIADLEGALAESAAREIGAQAAGFAVDVRNRDSFTAFLDGAEDRFGPLDALVNNAGVAVFKRILDTTWEEWRHVISTNLEGAFLCTQQCAPVMLRGGGGAVVNIASISGLRASTMRVAYGTSKGALIHLTKQQAIELGNAGIRVNCVAPGPVDTEMSKLVHTVAIRSDYYDAIPLNRYGTTEEIAEAVGWLCSPAASYINGQTLAADGGFDASGVGLPTLRRTA